MRTLGGWKAEKRRAEVVKLGSWEVEQKLHFFLITFTLYPLAFDL
jgi:hypothetical protein